MLSPKRCGRVLEGGRVACLSWVLVCTGLISACGGSIGIKDTLDGSSGPDTGASNDTGTSKDVQAPPSACGSEAFQPPTGGKSYYVAPNGSDSAAGTLDAPFKTMKKAAGVAAGGDVVYLRDGVYGAAENFQATGVAGKPVVFMAYPGEHPILDGQGLSLGQSDSVLQLYQPAHVIVAGLEIRNSKGRGVQLIDAEDVVIRDCTIHDTAYKALGLNGHNLVAEGNTIFNAVMSNASSSSSGGWASAVTTQLLEDGSPSGNVVVRGNVVRDAWGECIDALFVDGMTIAGNEVRDCYSVGIYVDTARAVRIEGNVIRAISESHRRKDTGHFMDGILMGAEAYSDGPDFGVEDVVIANNIILGTHLGIGWWDDSENSSASNTYQRLQIAFNVVWGVEQDAVMFDEVPSGRTSPTSVMLANNVLYRGSLTGAASVRIGNPGPWSIVNNVFPEGLPSVATDASNLAVDPQLTAPGLEAAPDAFRPAGASPCRHAGRPVAAVPLDFTCATRGTGDTTVGAFE